MAMEAEEMAEAMEEEETAEAATVVVAKVPGPEAAGAARVVVAMEGARAEARESAGRAAVVTAAVAAMAAGLREEESNSYP